MNDLLKRSAELADATAAFLAAPPYDGSARISSSRTLCEVSFEHAESVRVLLGAGNFTSALGVLRMQYEALVRSVWVLYSASDAAVAKLQSELKHQTANAADKVPALGEMLGALEGKAPLEASKPLAEFKEYAWKPLSSYIHGGIHAVSRHTKGYPVELLTHVAKSSNGLLLMAAMMLVVLSGDSRYTGQVAAMQRDFADCCPRLADCGPKG
jgi:hypothetical protein